MFRLEKGTPSNQLTPVTFSRQSLNFLCKTFFPVKVVLGCGPDFGKALASI
jgi:hypothetical protein